MTVLYESLYGSKLYGTSTPQSDTDYKGIYLPALDHVLLGEKVGNLKSTTNGAFGKKNGADDVDREQVPLVKFANDFLSGQIYALELAFTYDGDHAEQTFNQQQQLKVLTKAFLMELKTHFLTKDLSSLVAYTRHQSQLYSDKGRRLNVLSDLHTKLMDLYASVDPTTKDTKLQLLDLGVDKLAELTTSLNGHGGRIYLRQETTDSNQSAYLVVYDKVYDIKLNVHALVFSIKNQISKYGSRVKIAAEQPEAVDWKAIAHSLRIAEQGVQLITDRRLTLPVTSDLRETLLDIRAGKIPLAVVQQMVLDRLELIEEAIKTSSLPTREEIKPRFDQWLLTWVKTFYKTTGEL